MVSPYKFHHIIIPTITIITITVEVITTLTIITITRNQRPTL